MRLSKSSLRRRHARRLQGPADPLFGRVDQAGNDADHEVVLRAHVGHHDVDAVEDLQDRADPLLAVGLHGADFAQREVRILAQGRVPDHSRHVPQCGSEPAQLFLAQVMLGDARPPLSPYDFRYRRRIESVRARHGGRRSIPRVAGRNRHLVQRQFGRIGVRRAGQQLDERADFLLTDARRIGQLGKRRPQQVFQGPARKRPAAIGGRSATPNRPAASSDGRHTAPKAVSFADSRSG